MFKAVATKIALFAFDTTTGAAKTGDAANISAYLSKDYGAVTQLTDTSASELDSTNAKGWYLFDVTGTEATADALLFSGKSSTANISVVGQLIYTTPNRFSSLVIDAAGLADATAVKVGPSGAATAQTAGDVVAKIDAVDDYVDTEVAAIKAKTDNLPSDPADASDIAAAFASLNTKVDTIDDFLDTEIAAIKAKTDNLPTDPADASDIATATNAIAALIGTPAGASLSADVAAVKVDTAAILVDTGTTLDGKIDAIDDFLDTEVAAIKAKTDNLPSDPADQSLIMAAIGALPADVADQVWEETLADHSGTVGSAAEQLAAAGAAGDPWATPLPGAYGAGTAGKIVGDNVNATISSRASQTSVDTIDDFLDTEIAAIKAKTDNLPSDPADASDIAGAFTALNTKVDTIDDFLDTEIAAIKLKTDNLPSDPADASDIATATNAIAALIGTPAGVSLAADVAAVKVDTAAILVDTGTTLDGKLDAIDAIVDAIVIDTAEIGAAGAGLTALATQASVNTIDDFLDTEVAAIKAKTDNLPSDPADASDIAAAFATVNATLATIGAYVDTEVAAIKAKTDNLPSDPADASDLAAAFATVNATLATIAGYVDTEVAAIKLKTDNLPSDPADASDIAAAFATVNATLATIAAYLDTEVAAIKAKTDNLPAAPAATGDAMTLTGAYDFAKGSDAMAESYAANGVAPSPVQALFAIHQMLMSFEIIGASIGVKTLAGGGAFAVTLDSAIAPTSATRA